MGFPIASSTAFDKRAEELSFCIRRRQALPLCMQLRPDNRGLTAFLYQRMRDYCIGMISSRWRAKGVNVCGAGVELAQPDGARRVIPLE